MHAHKPLVRQTWLDNRITAIAVTHAVLMRLDLHQRADGLEQLHDARTCFETVEAFEFVGNASCGQLHFTQHAVGIDDDRHGERMSLADFEVVCVVCGSDFHRPRAERGIGVCVGDDGNTHAVQWQDELLSNELRVARIIGIHGNSHITQHRFRSGGGDRDGLRRCVGEGVAQMIELAGRLGELGFLVGQRRPATRAPVNDAVSLVNQSIFVQAHERFTHGRRQLRREGVSRARPVGTRADRLELIENLAARLLDKRHNPFHKRLASQIEACVSFNGELLFDDILRRDACVIGAGYPQRLVGGHPTPTDQDILHRVVEPMAHMQYRGDVWRWHDDDKGLALGGAFGAGGENTMLGPTRIPARLRGRGVVVR